MVGHQVEVAPWMGCPWVEEAEMLMRPSAEAVARGAGFQWQGWKWWSCFVAMALEHWLPCCWWVEGEEPAVAMAEEVPWGVQVVLGPGPLEEGVAASRAEAFHWDLVA